MKKRLFWQGELKHCITRHFFTWIIWRMVLSQEAQCFVKVSVSHCSMVTPRRHTPNQLVKKTNLIWTWHDNKTSKSRWQLLVCRWRHGGHVGGQEQKHFSPLGTKLYFHVNSSRKYSFVLTPNMAALSRGCKPRIFCQYSDIKIPVSLRIKKSMDLANPVVWNFLK